MNKATVYMHNETAASVKGLKVFVYYNLHKKVFSVKALEGANKGRVIAHTRLAKLNNVTFKVSEAGRQRVLKERKKNVHAGVQGTLHSLEHITVITTELVEGAGFTKAYYNPYKTASFMNGAEALTTANKACLIDKQVYFR